MANDIESHKIRKSLIVLIILVIAGLVAQGIRYLTKD